MSQRLKERKNKNRQRKTVKQLDSERQTDRVMDRNRQTQLDQQTYIIGIRKEKSRGKPRKKTKRNVDRLFRISLSI